MPGRPTIWMIVGQGPIALAVGAGGGCMYIFTLLCPFLSLGDSLIWTEIVSLRAAKLKTTNQPSCPLDANLGWMGDFVFHRPVNSISVVSL